jgi:hypothetical protein
MEVGALLQGHQAFLCCSIAQWFFCLAKAFSRIFWFSFYFFAFIKKKCAAHHNLPSPKA